MCKSYPVIEKHDAIFIWFGLDPNEPPAELAFRSNWPVKNGVHFVSGRLEGQSSVCN